MKIKNIPCLVFLCIFFAPSLSSCGGERYGTEDGLEYSTCVECYETTNGVMCVDQWGSECY